MAEMTVVAMGGNSLLDPSKPITVANQFAVTREAIVPVADLLLRGEKLVLTHGNGPQVGFMLLRSELSREHIHEVPLDSLGADSQGAIGYMIQRLLREELALRGAEREVATIVTETEVDANDQAFQNPTKPVGMFYTAEQAVRFEKERNWRMVEDSKRGWRRVVPSPQPLRIVQFETIKRMVEAGVLVIAVGGGGIPVMREADGHIRGIEAVIDKDRATALLAVEMGVRRLMITTGVDAIYRDYLIPEKRTALREVTTGQLKEMAASGQFPPGSMGPKVEAAIYFLERGGEEVVICKPEDLAKAFDGKAGSIVRK